VSIPEQVTDRGYGSKIAAVEPGGVEFIPLAERHGSSRQLLWTFCSPNMEFATVGVGILGTLGLGMSFWHTFLAIVLGVALGALFQGILSVWGPRHGLPQMVIGRSAFGYLGNILPAGVNTIVAGVGWFAVNSVSGALALHALFSGLDTHVCLVLVLLVEIAIAFCGHNLVQAMQRYAGPVLAVVFVVASIWVLTKVHPGAASQPIPGAFLIETTAVFGYAAGWNPFAADYTRYLAPDTRRGPLGFYSGFGIVLSCVLLMTAGAAVVTAGQTVFDPSAFTNLLPTFFGKVTLVAVVVGATAANAMNIYSGSMSFMALGIDLPTRRARALIGLALSVAGAVVSFYGLPNAGATYTNYLLIIGYTIAPWLGVVLVDRLLRRGQDIQPLLEDRRFVNLAGPVAYAVSAVVSIWLFSNQTKYIGLVPKNHPGVGDLTCLVGFVLAAAVYAVIHRLVPPHTTPVATPAGPQISLPVTKEATTV
jgi:purine-cytosine permease-like protein